MPIKLEQLKRQLNAEQFSFMITGDEPLLMMEAGDSIRAFLRQQGFTERSVFDIGRNFDFNDVSQESDNFSLFAEKKIIELRFEKLPDKAQQDAFLPRVEAGDITLVGATTENPSFEVNAALLSRSRVFVLKPLEVADLVTILTRSLDDPERGLGGRGHAAAGPLIH